MEEYKTLSVKTEKFTMEYLKFGTGSKIMVILPGLSLCSVIRSARAIVKAYSVFSKDYTVYLFDRKKEIERGYTVYDMAEDSALALKTLKLNGVYLLGVSQGGMIAEVLAIRYPELIKKLVLSSTLSRLNDTAKKTLFLWGNIAATGDHVKLNENIFSKIYSKETLDNNKVLLALLKQEGSEEDCKRFVILADATNGFDVNDELDKIKCKTLVIGAENDAVVTGNSSREMAEKLNCDLYMYDKYGHAVYDEAPDFKERVAEFFKD